jgi:hypothetical protein
LLPRCFRPLIERRKLHDAQERAHWPAILAADAQVLQNDVDGGVIQPFAASHARAPLGAARLENFPGPEVFWPQVELGNRPDDRLLGVHAEGRERFVNGLMVLFVLLFVGELATRPEARGLL